MTVLQGAIPEEWILRHVTERDYGIDAYVELVTPKGEVMGDLVSIQLRGTESSPPEWKEKNGQRLFDHTGTSTSTVAYWMRLPVPVFLFVADVEAKRVWFADVKSQVRRRYNEFAEQKTFTFEMYEQNEMGPSEGVFRFLIHYTRQRQHERFVSEVLSIISAAEHYVDFLRDHSGRDEFLALEPDELITFARLMNSSEFIAQYLGIEWTVKSFHDLCVEDAEQCKQPRELHEATLIKHVHQIAAILSNVVRAVEHHVLVSHNEFWNAREPVLFQAFMNYNFKYLTNILDGL